MKVNLFPFALLIFLPFNLPAQSNEIFYSELTKCWQGGNTAAIADLMDENVSITQNGKEKAYSRTEAKEELLEFFRSNQPGTFSLKHKGTSQDGQVYLVGYFNTQGGQNFKVVCRARNFQTGYRIFKLDLVRSN